MRITALQVLLYNLIGDGTPVVIAFFFSEPLDPATAQSVSNYSIPSLTITGAELQSDGCTVRLNVQALNPDVSYDLTASGIQDLAPSPNTMQPQTIAVSKPLQFPFRVNIAGDAWTTYLADQVFTRQLEYGRTGGTVVNHPEYQLFDNTDEDEVYRDELRNPTFYQVYLPEGMYAVTLMFAETEYSSAGSRVFDVLAEGQVVIDDLDIFAEAGNSRFTAVEKSLGGIEVTDGVLDIYFQGIAGQPVISGIRIVPAQTCIPGRESAPASPFRLSASPNPFDSHLTIRFESVHDINGATLGIYDIGGRLVREWGIAEMKAGTHTVQWNGRDSRGAELGPGAYFVRITSGEEQVSARVVLMR